MTQLSLFEDLCRKCDEFTAEYDGMCDGCASDEAYLTCLFWKENGFNDYSHALQKMSREEHELKFIVFERANKSDHCLNNHDVRNGRYNI